MSIVEGTYLHEGVTVKYKYRKAIGDRRNLIVIFSGFRDPGTYDFDGGPILSIRGNILWILDDFSDNFAYYLCTALDFSVERAIASLIEQAMNYLGIAQDQCTAAGFSKGGSAALYYGIKYNYGAILATAPQMHIGSSVKKKWPEVFRAMTNDGSSAEREYLDSLLPNLLREDTNLARNVYLFSSEADPQHKSSIEPYLSELGKYSNFNYILTSSPLVDTHSAVTRYNVPTITSIMSLLSEGAKPVLGNLRNGSLAPGNAAPGLTLDQVCSRNEVVHSFTSLSFQGSVLHPDGYAFVKGYPADQYGKVRTRILFRGEGMTYEVPMGGVKDPLLSTRFYEHQYCDYSMAKFTSLAHKGVPLSGLPEGKYNLSLTVCHGGNQHLVPATSNRPRSVWSVGEGYLYKIETDESRTTLTKRPALGATARGAYFKEGARWAAAERIHFEGYFAVEGIPTANYHDVKYYLVLCLIEGGAPIEAFPLASDHRAQINEQFSGSWLDYSKAYYATPRYEGIELTGTPPGRYAAFVTARFGDAVFSEPLEGVVSVAALFDSHQLPNRPTVDIVGSCVSRDNFNGRLSPDWKSYFSLGNEHYQSSFLSLMSKPVEVPAEELTGPDQHSTRVTVRDFEKQYLVGLVSGAAPDVLIVDFFADARFGCLRAQGSLVTNNEWKLHNTPYWTEAVDERQTLNLWDDEEEYLQAFRTAAQEFETLRRRNFPKTRVILNGARAVYSYFNKGTRVEFPKKFVSELNMRWSKLDELFLQYVPAEVISGGGAKTLSDSSHPRGPSPYNYEPEFYRIFREELLRTLGYEMKISLE
ncbi:DUF6270 domain-containing protein [Arthrobacter zhaoxinii]|uniref:DUF6270 domain-containing protein n=1 Tax=Arthrobacter zhaoxinii TaxID=2964616 RepID=A0ABY5YN56_9MICC|nr:accessory Sec system protein Asp2 [Arthrobacter zhaoxinii]UWX96113.1 DUF6270 domain-containing protein [Arthrobacter zhaoxinii]